MEGIMFGLTAYNLLQGAMASLRLGFSSIHDFLDAVRDRFSALPYSGEAAIQEIDKCIAASSHACQDPAQFSVQERATAHLLVPELRLVRRELSTLGEEYDLVNTLADNLALYKRALNDLGIFPFDYPELFVVEKYPEPVSNVIWSAGSFFHEDERQYGMKRGIYFRRDKLAPRMSSALLAHELIHFAMEREGKIIPRRLEEGMCDLIGSCYLGGLALGFELGATIVRNNLHNTPSDTLWWLYAANLSQATQLYARFGLTGLVQAINEEQKADFLRDVERTVLKGQTNTLLIPSGHFVDALTVVLNALSAMPIHFTLSPLAALVARRTSEDQRLQNLAEEYRLTQMDMDMATEELAQYPLMLVNDGRVVSETATSYFMTGALRYRLPVNSLARLLGQK
jgi:hypothetical protein